MINSVGKYLSQANQQCESAGLISYKQPTIAQSLKEQLAKSQEEQQRLTELLELLDKNPDFERMLTLLGQR